MEDYRVPAFLLIGWMVVARHGMEKAKVRQQETNLPVTAEVVACCKKVVIPFWMEKKAAA